MELNSLVTALSLFNLHAHLPDTPDSTRPLEESPSRPSSTRTAPYLVIQSPDTDQMQSSTLICLPTPFLPPSLPLSFFMSFPQLPPSIFVTFPLSPTASIHLCPRSPSLESFLLYHCRAPHCFSPPRPFFFLTN